MNEMVFSFSTRMRRPREMPGCRLDFMRSAPVEVIPPLAA
jgi:hypothetical protein